MKYIKKKSLFVLFCLMALLYQCKNEQPDPVENPLMNVPKVTATDEIVPGDNELLDNYLKSAEFKAFCSRFSFEPTTYFKAKTNLNAEFFAIKVQHIGNTPSLKDYYIMVYPMGNKYNTLLYEELYQGENIKLAIFETDNYTYLAGRDVSPRQTENGIVMDRSCYTENSSFSGCYTCGWSVLMNDSSSAAACLMMLVVCDGAVVAHCLGWTT